MTIYRETLYEWDQEESDSYGDIQEHHHSPDLKMSGYDRAEFNEPRTALVLIKDWHDYDRELHDRSWAYATEVDGKLVLPTHFDGGDKVPQRFHKELARWQK